MKRPLPAIVALLALCPLLFADYSVSKHGDWPKSWPGELDPLRKQARTLEGPLTAHRHYEIPFTRADEFQAAWPHLLKVKSAGAPIILVRSPHAYLGSNLKAGVIVHTPPENTDKTANREAPIKGQSNRRTTWLWTTYLELVVDGDTVNLNQTPLPPNTPIIDERFPQPPQK